MTLIIAAIIFFPTVFLKVNYDFKRWQRRLPVNHLSEIAVVAIPMSAVIGLLIYHSDYSFPYSWLFSVLLVCGWYLFLFNGGYNSVRHFYWFFIGSQDANDSFTEKFFRAIGMPATVILQVLLIIISTYLYFR